MSCGYEYGQIIPTTIKEIQCSTLEFMRNESFKEDLDIINQKFEGIKLAEKYFCSVPYFDKNIRWIVTENLYKKLYINKMNIVCCQIKWHMLNRRKTKGVLYIYTKQSTKGRLDYLYNSNRYWGFLGCFLG